MRFFWAIRRFVKGLPWQVKRMFYWLRDGYDPEHLWAIDTACSRWLIPRLEGFRDNHSSYPGEDISPEMWFAMIDKMAQTFRFIDKDEYYLWHCGPNTTEYGTKAEAREREQYVSEGLHLFAEYFTSLWD